MKKGLAVYVFMLLMLLTIILGQMIIVLGEKRGNLVDTKPPVGSRAQDVFHVLGSSELIHSAMTSAAREALCNGFASMETALQEQLDTDVPTALNEQQLFAVYEKEVSQKMHALLKDHPAKPETNTPFTLYTSDTQTAVYATQSWLVEENDVTVSVRPIADLPLPISVTPTKNAMEQLAQLRNGKLLAACAQQQLTTTTREEIVLCMETMVAEFNTDSSVRFDATYAKKNPTLPEDVYKLTANIPSPDGCSEGLTLSQETRILPTPLP